MACCKDWTSSCSYNPIVEISFIHSFKQKFCNIYYLNNADLSFQPKIFRTDIAIRLFLFLVLLNIDIYLFENSEDSDQLASNEAS